MLYNIFVGGVLALCSDLIVGGERKEEVQFLSVAGHQTAVKGVLANVLEGHALTVQIQGNSHYLTRAKTSYHMRVCSLASGLAHGVLFPQSALPMQAQAEEDQPRGSFFLLSHEPKATQSIFFRQLNARLSLPLHPSWGPWLWRLFEDAGWLEQLTSLAGVFDGYLVTLQADMLRIEINQALQERQPELSACFQQAS